MQLIKFITFTLALSVLFVITFLLLLTLFSYAGEELSEQRSNSCRALGSEWTYSTTVRKDGDWIMICGNGAGELRGLTL